MKASRLLSIALVLQSHGRLTTKELASRFEVSRRTILRDIEALSSAGLPVYAERGRHGAIVLDQSLRLDLTKLEPNERQLLRAIGLDADHLSQIGLRSLGQRTLEKLEARSRHSESHAPALDDVIVIDHSSWFTTPKSFDLSELLSAVRGGKRLIIKYRHNGTDSARTYTLDPYGLACKQSQWYLVGDVEGKARMFNTARLLEANILDSPAQLREGWTLSQVWKELVHSFTTRPDITVRARLRSNRLDLASRILGTRLTSATKGHDGWSTVTISYPDIESVRQLLQFGDHIEVLHPRDARNRMRELAAQLVAAHA